MKEKNVLVLQGGGALGAYQAGAYEALAAAGHIPEWVAGISIGAINGAIIAGNRPKDRVPRLREFWERVSSLLPAAPFFNDDTSRKAFGETSAALVAITGAPGFFEPRIPPAVFMPRGSPEAMSLYDTAPLLESLRELVDFDILNSGSVRLSVGAVQVRTANMKYFDTAEQEIRAEHIMASGALPPGFPPIVIDEEPYWDGGLVSNTPLHHVLEETRSAPRHVHLPARPLQRDRAGAGVGVRYRAAREGDPLFEPDAAQHGHFPRDAGRCAGPFAVCARISRRLA